MTKLLLPNAVTAGIRMYLATRTDRNEHGGLLLGYRKAGAIEVKEATFPNRWDKASPIRFYRSAVGHRTKALREWIVSGGTVGWVGEWHSHPFGSSNPSSIDRNSWRAISNHTGEQMVFLIFGLEDVFVGSQFPRYGAFRSLSLAEQSDDADLYQ
ncbi:Mov34/MPN/PAD-1 family protein [Agrobacterium fabrum]|uniref:Mov34/MPN/PAD-1 family protein n=1 Tax=Agrobacterium fabrum TaxID=1176649 RepID=UPI000B81E83A